MNTLSHDMRPRVIAACILSGMLLLLVGCGDARRLPGGASGGIGPGYFTPRAIGDAPEGNPMVTDLTIADLDRDGLLDIVFTEGLRNEVRWLRQSPTGVYSEHLIEGNVMGAAHVEVDDVDNDGDNDLLVASMGVVMPSPAKIGSIVILEQTTAGSFKRHTLQENTHRVTDIRAADLDGDGDKDLAVAKFGYDEGEAIWMENLGNWDYTPHPLLSLSGTIHIPIGDINGDSRPDITTVASQEWEEIYVFENQGDRKFGRRVVFGSTNEDYGSSGITLCDVDQDHDLDIIYTNGDAFDYGKPGPRPWHGVQWLENDGSGEFTFHRLGNLGGAYSPVGTDIDGDGDIDIVASSTFNDWENPRAISLICYENTGNRKFVARPLAYTPTHLVVVKAADMDGDGDVELVSGSFFGFPPFEKIARITLWER